MDNIPFNKSLLWFSYWLLTGKSHPNHIDFYVQKFERDRATEAG